MEPSVPELLAEGVKLTAVGMTIVFGFLLLLVGILLGMSRLVSRLAPDQAVPERPVPPNLPGLASESDPRLAAAITAAVSYYRRNRRT
ncbi:MAG: OadG family protein [Chromatiaceae bacterium]